MDNDENVDSTDLPEWLADLVKTGEAKLLTPEEGREMLFSLFEMPTCTDPDCNWPTDPETLAALCVTTFVVAHSEANEEAYHKGLIRHPESLTALADWAEEKLSEVIGKAMEWEASQPQ